jgi:predicted nucleic acid-binding protein
VERLSLDEATTVYLDAAAIIYSVERHEDYSKLLEPLWDAVSAESITAITSSLTLLEVLVVPIRNQDHALIGDYRSLLESSELVLHPIDESVLFEAATIRAGRNIKTPDAIHAATAMINRCDMFITNDRAFRHLAGLNAVVLTDMV